MTMATGDNRVPLNAELTEKFRGYFRNIRTNTIELAKEAFHIHNERFSPAERKYDKDFEGWWKTQGLDEVFGSRPAWSKWHKAGEAIEKVHAKFEKYADKLPTSRDALYEIAKLDNDELSLCLQNTYRRTSVLHINEADWKRPSKPKPLINPLTTAGAIKSWRENWRAPPPPKTERRTVPFITIYVHGSLYNFDPAGKPTGLISPEQIRNINAEIVEVLSHYDDVVRLDSKLEVLSENYTKRWERAIQAAQKKGKKTKK